MLKEILHVIKNLDRKILWAKRKLFMLKSLRSTSTKFLDGIPKSISHNSAVENLAIKIVVQEKKISELEKIEGFCRYELYWLLKEMFDEETFKVLFLRYGYLCSFRKIARLQKISLGKVFKIHSRALENFS